VSILSIKVYLIYGNSELVQLVSRAEEAPTKGVITDFFPFRGGINYISTEEGSFHRYILCWFEDKEDDFNKAGRRQMGVTFSNGIIFVTDEENK
jgi:hypothetical protein